MCRFLTNTSKLMIHIDGAGSKTSAPGLRVDGAVEPFLISKKPNIDV